MIQVPPNRRGQGRDQKGTNTSQEFFEKLAAELINADATTEATMTRSAMVARANTVASTTEEFQRPTKRHRSGKPTCKKQNNCTVCKKSTTYVCHLCSSTRLKETFVCSSSTGRECWDSHFKKHHCDLFACL